MSSKRSSKIIEFVKTYGKLMKFAGVLLAIAVIAVLLQPIILKLIQSNPDLNSTYLFIKLQIDNKSILWLFIVSFVGTFFFIGIPTDFLYLYYIIGGANPIETILAVFFGVFLSRMANFWFGHIFRDYTYKHIITENADSFNRKFSKWGSALLFWGNYIPGFPMEPFNVFVGTTKYKFKKFLVYQGLGKFIKLIIIWIFVQFFVQQQILLSFDLFSMVRSILEAIFMLTG